MLRIATTVVLLVFALAVVALLAVVVVLAGVGWYARRRWLR